MTKIISARLASRLLHQFPWSRSVSKNISAVPVLLFTNGFNRENNYSATSTIQTIPNARFYSTRRSVTKSKKNYYDVLGVSPRSTHNQIKAAFYKLSKEFHPDVNKDEDAQDRFAEISEAYEVLGTKRTRHLYDRGMYSSHPGAASRPYPEADDIPAEEFWKRQTFKERKPPPTGRTKVYNFDEFYEKHYGETVERVKIKKEKIEEFKEEEKFREYMNVGSQRTVVLLIFLAVLVLFINKDDIS